MIQRILFILFLMVLMTSCGGAAPATQPPAATEAPAATEPPALQSLEAPTQAAPQGHATSTSQPAATQALSTLTDTPLPTLELPTEIINAPSQMVWDGTP